MAESMQVAAESNALRAVLPVVDGQDKVEAILDPGCQIVAMSEEVCNALALPYDPTIRLSMVSANGGVDQSLGLARNVPFLVGDITLYLQVHVLRAPAYDILLGRPFDVLTQSVVHNFADENQTVTILDPNTGRKATIPTIARGSYRFADRRIQKDRSAVKSQDF
jgi:copper chaperone CopZ